MNLKYARISEVAWLIITFLTAFYALYIMYNEGAGEWPYFIITVVAFCVYLFRRMLRKRFEKQQQE